MRPTRENDAWGGSPRWHDSVADDSTAGFDTFDFFDFFTFTHKLT